MLYIQVNIFNQFPLSGILCLQPECFSSLHKKTIRIAKWQLFLFRVDEDCFNVIENLLILGQENKTRTNVHQGHTIRIKMWIQVLNKLLMFGYLHVWESRSGFTYPYWRWGEVMHSGGCFRLYHWHCWEVHSSQLQWVYAHLKKSPVFCYCVAFGLLSHFFFL